MFPPSTVGARSRGLRHRSPIGNERQITRGFLGGPGSIYAFDSSVWGMTGLDWNGVVELYDRDRSWSRGAWRQPEGNATDTAYPLQRLPLYHRSCAYQGQSSRKCLAVLRWSPHVGHLALSTVKRCVTYPGRSWKIRLAILRDTLWSLISVRNFCERKAMSLALKSIDQRVRDFFFHEQEQGWSRVLSFVRLAESATPGFKGRQASWHQL
jgi:hypothetical protein